MIYAVCRATNYYRNRPDTRPDDVYNALRQWAREAAFNHTNTSLRAPQQVEPILPTNTAATQEGRFATTRKIWLWETEARAHH